MAMKSITKKSENISEWYNELIHAAKLAEHGPSKGSIIMRPYGYAIWERMQGLMDLEIKRMGVDNAYFPLFIPMSFLQKEQHHVEGFSPELAVVTHGGGEKLVEPLVVRPTSETIIYDAFSRWIQSFRDLPLKVNQWCNVVRWEKRPNLFLRTTEFLWQEGHTAHKDNDDAQKMVEEALTMYIDFYQQNLAMFGYSGRKSESEKFAGADATFTYEMLMPDGKVVQGCTSHNLGQNFSKVFKVQFQDENKDLQYVWQTSWGFSTRSIGSMILMHGDDKGLVLPPKVAPIQVVIIPITKKEADNTKTINLSKEVFTLLQEKDIRVKLDDTDQSPGWKFNQYDMEGVPLRIEIGPQEAESGEVSIMTRFPLEAENSTAKLSELVSEVNRLLDQTQKSLFERSKEHTLKNTVEIDSYEEFKEVMEKDRKFIKAFWCEDERCEAKIKEETKATTRCLPFDSEKLEGKCIYCGKDAEYRWLFAQSY